MVTLARPVGRRGDTRRMDWRDLARRQAGVISRRQLADCGLTHRQIDGLVQRRDLVELLPGVYAPRPVPSSALQQYWAASLWSDGGVISHRSAAPLWQVPVAASRLVHLTVADRRYRKPPPAVRLHRVQLDRRQLVDFDGLPVTARARTVVDLLRTERFGAARDLRDRAVQQGWVDEVVLSRAIGEQPGRAGNKQLRLLLAGIEPGAQAESERRLHALLRRAGLRGWVPQYRARLGRRIAMIDVAFPARKLAIEIDGRRYHDGASERFEDDRDRQNALVAAGWQVLRFTWRQLTQQPEDVLTQIVQLLAA